MVIRSWNTIRISLLALTLLGTLGVLFKVMLSPLVKHKEIGYNNTFPQQVPLSGWQQITTNPLKITRGSSIGLGLGKGQSYRYEQADNFLDIEARYEKYNGDGNRFLIIYQGISPGLVDPQIKHQKGIGYYGLFEYKNKAYLSACVTPKGESTMTRDQFNQNRYAHGWGLERTLLFIIGQQDLFDERCLWTVISLAIPADPNQNTLDNENLKPTYEKLEKAWFDWYQWWKPNLPSY